MDKEDLIKLIESLSNLENVTYIKIEYVNDDEDDYSLKWEKE